MMVAAGGVGDDPRRPAGAVPEPSTAVLIPVAGVTRGAKGRIPQTSTPHPLPIFSDSTARPASRPAQHSSPSGLGASAPERHQ
jgi:hypothetical protein